MWLRQLIKASRTSACNDLARENPSMYNHVFSPNLKPQTLNSHS